MSTTVRVSNETHERLAALAAVSGRNMHTIVDEAVAEYEARQFWDAFAAGYDRLAEDADNWAQVEAERAGEASALSDGFNRAP